jgi:hypothetical protein
MIVRTAAIAAMAIAVSACAKHPDSIAASYVSQASFRGLSCGALAQESVRLNSILSRASTQQENARTNDVIGILLIGVPVSTLSGDNIAPEIARLKGEQDALNRRMLEAGCSSDGGDEVREERPARRNVVRQRRAASAFEGDRETVQPARSYGVSSDDPPRRAEKRGVSVYRVMMQDVEE